MSDEHAAARGRMRVRRRRVRRWAAALVGGSAVVSVLSSITPPLPSRLRFVLDLGPVELPQAASVALVFAAVALLLLSRGLRRGQRHAWFIAVLLLVLSAGLNLAKGADVEEAAIALGVCGWLVWQRRYFAVHANFVTVRRALLIGLLAPPAAVATAAVLVLTFGAHRHESVHESIDALAERLAGDRVLPLAIGSEIANPALVAVGVAVVIAMGWLLFSPQRHEPPSDGSSEARARARDIVAHHGGGSLDYFALRGEKSYLFTGQSVVAYAVRNGVCLVSPDPIGPERERADVLADLLDMADRNGWSVAVLGAASQWLPVYEDAGMRAVYIGDEAVVDCQRFSMDGGTMRTLRGAYNRVRKSGFNVTFHDPTRIDDSLRSELADVLQQTRRGDCERGFSMTLGRIFDPSDEGLLLAVGFDPGGRVAAFCQYVPAVGIGGYSLDLMRRRADPDLPNGVIDYVVVQTIHHLREQGCRGLALNFAAFREVIAGERCSRLAALQRRVLIRFSDTMQIESLWRYNEKFRPDWQPRYAVVDSLENVVIQGLAIGKAESLWELPAVGRILKPQPTAARTGVRLTPLEAPPALADEAMK